jgi:hypothetical protein
MTRPTLDNPSRRAFFPQLTGGIGGLALSWLLAADDAAARGPESQLSEGLHHPAKAKRVVQLFMSGAASQCDTFDYKPLLAKQNGQPWDPGQEIELFQSSPGSVMQSPWPWKQYGECGKWINDCVAPLGEHVDDMAFVHNMISTTNVHGPATFLQATGFVLPGFPGMGSWISYGLGRMTDELPTFVVLPDPRGFAPNGPRNWGSGFLPAEHQGTIIRPSDPSPIANLFPPRSAAYIDPGDRGTILSALERMNQLHLNSREGDSRLQARMQTYELAARMQMAAPQLFDLSDEPQSVRDAYGIDRPDVATDDPMNEGEETRFFGKNCLIARRLLERGVRFVQIWSGADNGFPRRNWDSHEDLRRDHWPLGRGMATGAAALIADLKQRDMLKDTLILWTTEFGRMPCSQGNLGRDHNPFGFTNWLAGGGVRGGTTVGESDPWSWRPADPNHATTCYDIHATMLHLMGIDHTRLTFRNNGIDRRLTDVHGQRIDDLIG